MRYFLKVLLLLLFSLMKQYLTGTNDRNWKVQN